MKKEIIIGMALTSLIIIIGCEDIKDDKCYDNDCYIAKKIQWVSQDNPTPNFDKNIHECTWWKMCANFCVVIDYQDYNEHMDYFNDSYKECVGWIEKQKHPIRVKLWCGKDYVGCHIGDEEYYGKTWNEDGCTVPLIEVDEYVTWLPCTGFLQAGDEFCRYPDKGNFEMNIHFIENYAKNYDCRYEYVYENESP